LQSTRRWLAKCTHQVLLRAHEGFREPPNRPLTHRLFGSRIVSAYSRLGINA
jgi:hypothetical protein